MIFSSKIRLIKLLNISIWNVSIKMLHPKNLKLRKCKYHKALFIGYNGLRVGDVALCCACGKAILLTRCFKRTTELKADVKVR